MFSVRPIIGEPPYTCVWWLVDKGPREMREGLLHSPDLFAWGIYLWGPHLSERTSQTMKDSGAPRHSQTLGGQDSNFQFCLR